jgi:hypothetical protein
VIGHRVQRRARAPAVALLRWLERGPFAAVARAALADDGAFLEVGCEGVVERDAAVDDEGRDEVVLDDEVVPESARHGGEFDELGKSDGEGDARFAHENCSAGEGGYQDVIIGAQMHPELDI